MSTSPSTTPHIRQWSVAITLFEQGDETHARAVLHADSPTQLEGIGQSLRGGHDATVPEIGDEVAAARALRHLADRLLDTAAGDIEQLTGELDVTLRPL
jgi:hypothetical protein